MRELLILLVFFSALASCRSDLQQDINKLTEMEKEIIKMSKELRNHPDSAQLQLKVDSMSQELRTTGLEMRQKYQEMDRVAEFEEAFKKAKEK